MELTTTLGVTRSIEQIYSPNSISELCARFKELKSKYSNITAVSRGQNWGYGCHAPTRSGGLVVNLSQCRQIKDFDSYHGVITLEPGVTYGELAEYLKNNGDEWMAPVHGGGADCSVVGNALERGYGITPMTDHFAAVMTLKALLPTGEIYEGTLSQIGLPKLDRLFKYGVGPYYDGLFTQSGLGIVTEMTIRLAKQPEFTEMFYFNLFVDDDLEAAVTAIKKSKQELGSVLGGVNLINRERGLSMLVNYPIELIQSRKPISEVELQKLAQQFMLTPWLVIGMLYGQKKIVQQARQQILTNFKDIKKRKLFYNSGNRYFFRLAGSLLKKIGRPSISESIQKIELAYQVLNGHPNNLALRLAYWKNTDKKLVEQFNLNPNRDNCGLIWYAPLVEMRPVHIRRYVNFITEASRKFNFNTLITLTTIDDLCFDSTIPILFNKNDVLDVNRATDFYNYLLNEGKKLGFFPYRLNIESQQQFDFQMKRFGLNAVNKSRYGSFEDL